MNLKTSTNKEFIQHLITNRIPLKNYPERVIEDFVLYEPSFFPFAGAYKGFAEYEKFVSKAIEYYDYNKFEFLNTYADDDNVFAILKVGVKNSTKEVLLCEQFVFSNEKISEIRVFVFE